MAGQLVPVEACEGWTHPCSFCERKFSKWIPIEEEDELSTIPTEPGAFMFAFETKRSKEVVAIGNHKTNIQTSVVQQHRVLRKHIAQKKTKETKASVLLRYVILEDIGSKDACIIYAHWQNYGTFPRMTTRWPGLDILTNSRDLEFYEDNQKWCYPIKDPVWRKQKVNAGPQAVQKCKMWFGNCGYCDSKFTVWLPQHEAVNRKENDRGAPPDRPGFCMYAANNQGKRQLLYICSAPSIKRYIDFYTHWFQDKVKQDKAAEPGSAVEVRWMAVNDLKGTDSCFMYAHFLNSGKELPDGYKLPGFEILEHSQNFVFRQRDKQWCHDESEDSQSKKVSKAKERREILRSALEDLHT